MRGGADGRSRAGRYGAGHGAGHDRPGNRLVRPRGGRGTGAGRGGGAEGRRFEVMRALGFDDILDVAEAPLAGSGAGGDGRAQGGCGAGGDRPSPHVTDGLGVLRYGGGAGDAGIYPGPCPCR